MGKLRWDWICFFDGKSANFSVSVLRQKGTIFLDCGNLDDNNTIGEKMNDLVYHGSTLEYDNYENIERNHFSQKIIFI